MSTEEMFYFKPTLTGHLVELRPFNKEATRAMLDILKDPEVLIKTGSVSSSEEVNTESSNEETRRWYETRNTQKGRLDLAIFCKKTQQYVGEVVFNDYDPKNHSVNYRIAVGEKGRGRGLGTEATKLMVDYGFTELSLNRISLEVFEFNKRARYVYSSCGFVTEGRLRQALYFNGTYHDALLKSVIREDWEATQNATTITTAPLTTVRI